MTRNIIFDLGGVLINWRPDDYLKTFHYDPKHEEILKEVIGYDPVWPISDLGVYPTYKEMLEEMVKHHPEYEKEFRAFFTDAWILNVYKPIAEGMKLFEKVRKAGYHIYVLSNFLPDAFRIIYEKYDFFRHVEGYVVSSYEGCRKPDSRIYHILLERYHLKPEESLFLDDSPTNVAAAKANNIQSFVYRGYDDAIVRLKDFGIEL